jgi:hypothetical protein
MAAQGFGICAHEPNKATYYGARYERVCSKFIAAIPATISKRYAFLNIERVENEG